MKLLAKSVKSKYEIGDKYALTLIGHLELGIQAALKFRTIAVIICDRLGLEITPDELVNTVAFAIWIHDWGKASGDFQALVYSDSKPHLLKDWYQINRRNVPSIANQAIRHELLSVILAYQIRPIYTWLKSASNIRFGVCLVGVLTHHLKTCKQSYFDTDKIAVPLKIHTSKRETDDFKKILQLGVKYFGLPSQLPVEILNTRYLKASTLRSWIAEIKSWCDKKVSIRCQFNLEKQKNIAAVKALVMGADLAASALFVKERGEREYTEWIEDALNAYLTAEEIGRIIRSTLKGSPLLPFQAKEKAYSSRVLIVVAGCGTGKTLVPFIRFQRSIEAGLKAKMFFCYPTTATTSQGFKEYGLNLAPAEIASISHSRSWIDYQLKFKDLMASYERESEDGEDFDREDDEIVSFQTKIEALKLWHSKLVFCTAHTVLGLVQNHRKGLYGFPAIAQGIFVFDEIHAYPPELFSALLQFLRIFNNTPVVLMSASLTTAREKAIQDVLAQTNESADVLRGSLKIERLKRYQITKIDSQDDSWNKVIAELKNGGQVLWITNQVADSQHIYTEAKHRFKRAGLDIEAINYHSRFRYLDSIKQHEQLVAAFKADRPVFAVTTQIAEMSLDISCTLLVSANAPMWTLIQRLGRLNRWINRLGLDSGREKYELRTGRICQALVYPWSERYPYELEDLETGDRLLELLQGKVAVSQQDLTEAITTLNLDCPELGFSTWLDTWKTKQGDLMPPSRTVSVILQDDVPKVFAESQRLNSQAFLEAQKFVISVRHVKGRTEKWPRNKAFKYYRLVPTEEMYYHPEIGAYSTKDHYLADIYGHDTQIK